MTASIARIESAGYQLWSPDEVATIDGWVVVSNGGFTRRLNSASTTTDASTSAGTRERIEAWLGERGAPMTVRVTPLIPESVLEGCVYGWNLVPRDETLVLAAEPEPSAASEVILVAPGDPGFVDDLFRLNGWHDRFRPAWDRLAARLGTRGIGLWIPGRAVGLVAETDRVGFVYSVAVDEGSRRQGLAVRVMEAAHAWALATGATVLTLQVLGTNAAARSLYESLGYDRLYTYHYLQARARERTSEPRRRGRR